jgi:hypothetical protein
MMGRFKTGLSLWIVAFCSISGAAAQDANCSTVFDCAKVAVQQASAARNALDDDRKLIKGLRDQLNALEEKLKIAQSQIMRLENNLGTWEKGKPRYSPDDSTFGGVLSPKPPNGPHITCDDGYYAVGLFLLRTGNGLNGAQLICRKPNSSTK